VAKHARNEKIEVGGLHKMHARGDERISYGKKLEGKSHLEDLGVGEGLTLKCFVISNFVVL
jgi:hypothetical protein